VPGTTGGGEFSYSFEADPGRDRTFILNWEIEARLSRINRSGKVEDILNAQRRHIGKVSEAEFNRIVLRFPIGPQPSFYRLDTSFKRTSGRELADYSEYIRVVKPRFDAHLALSTAVASPGDTIYFRIKNSGTKQLHFSEEFAIDQLNGSNWISYPAAIGPWHRVVRSLFAGQQGECQSFAIPADMPNGRYRVRKNLLREARPPLTAEFEVQG
jgi:hypothetical protein